jgi:hypothetical protein
LSRVRGKGICSFHFSIKQLKANLSSAVKKIVCVRNLGKERQKVELSKQRDFAIVCETKLLI